MLLSPANVQTSVGTWSVIAPDECVTHIFKLFAKNTYLQITMCNMLNRVCLLMTMHCIAMVESL